MVAILPVLGLGLAACGSSPPASRSSRAPGSHAGGAVVTIKDFAFSPATLDVAPGASVTVVNRDGVTHTLTSLSGAFDTGDLASGQTAHFTAPAKAGSYRYRCNIHQFMTGTLVVTSG